MSDHRQLDPAPAAGGSRVMEMEVPLAASPERPVPAKPEEEDA